MLYLTKDIALSIIQSGKRHIYPLNIVAHSPYAISQDVFSMNGTTLIITYAKLYVSSSSRCKRTETMGDVFLITILFISLPACISSNLVVLIFQTYCIVREARSLVKAAAQKHASTIHLLRHSPPSPAHIHQSSARPPPR